MIYLITLFAVVILLSSGCVSKEKTTNTKTDAIVDMPTTVNEKTLAVGEVLIVGNGVKIGPQSVDNGETQQQANTTKKQVFLSIVKDGNTLDKVVLENGENYNYGSILEFKIGNIYSTETADVVTLKNVVYRQDGKAPLKTSRFLTPGDTLELGQGLTMSIDQVYRESPRKALIVIRESGVKKDEKTVVPGEIYNYYNRTTINIDKIFSGPTIDIVTVDIIK
jgi:lipopolysaccharide export LptBFGC system permease protein LptF